MQDKNPLKVNIINIISLKKAIKKNNLQSRNQNTSPEKNQISNLIEGGLS